MSTASVQLLRKDARLASKVLLPAAALLAVAFFAWVVALEVPSLSAWLRTQGVAFPSMASRLGYVAAFVALVSMVVPCCVAVVLVHGDRAHGAALTSVTLPAPDTTKAGSKACVMLAAAAACVLACLGLATLAQQGGEPLAWSSVFSLDGHLWLLQLSAFACLSALLGTATALLADRLGHALVLSVLAVVAIGMLASGVAYAWFFASWGPWGLSRLFPNSEPLLDAKIRWTLMPATGRAAALASAIAPPAGVAAGALSVIAMRWRGIAGRQIACRWQAVGVGVAAAILGIAAAVAAVRCWGNLDVPLAKARSFEAGYRRVFDAPLSVLAVSIAGSPGQVLPEWTPEAQVDRIRRTSFLNATDGSTALRLRLLGAGSGDSSPEFEDQLDGSLRALWDRLQWHNDSIKAELSGDGGRALRREPWTLEQRIILAHFFRIEPSQTWCREICCQLLHELAIAQDSQQRLRLMGWIAPLMSPRTGLLTAAFKDGGDVELGVDPSLPTVQRLRARVRALISRWIVQETVGRYLEPALPESCLRDAERVLAILEAEQGDPFATSGANAP